MALVIADRVKETTTVTTGTATLLGAATGFQSFAVIGNGNTTYYCIAGQGTSEWEVGIGTYTLSGTTLARTTVLSNSSATQPSALTFSAGTKDVFVTYPSAKSVNLDASGNATALGTPASGTVTNLTGTASININGTVGATTANTGAFTTLSATGITTVAAGTAALPAIVSTTGTADTGLWFPAADTVAASTAGAERLRIDSGGKVGIGLTSYSLPLSVVGDGNGQNIQLNGRTGDSLVQMFFRTFGGANNLASISSDSGSSSLSFGTGSQTAPTVPTERMRINSSGNVGIGTSSPSYKLDVNGTLGVTGVATFTASPVISAITNTGTITLPTKTGTLALNTVTTQIFTTAGANTYTRPTGLAYALVYIKAGGASGASSTTGGYGASGGEGEEAWGIFTAATIGASQTVTIGAGGATVIANTSADGNAGGTTSFGALMTAAGPAGGTRGNFGGAPTAGGSGGTGGVYHMRGAAGHVGSDTSGNTPSYNAGGGKGGGTFAAAAGINSGGGGGGGSTGNNSGAGGSGICVVYEYY